MAFQCAFNLKHYPFDTQICSIDLHVPEFDQDYLQVIPFETGNKGPEVLDQFIITDVKIGQENNSSMIKCQIHMKRIPMYFIATTYMPTFCILFMALITLFIDQSHFEATIMVSLTTMLVMYTLFQSITISMPSTAYLKLLDYWLIFGLILPFIVFTTQIIDELIIENRNDNFNSRTTKFMEIARYALPIVTITFIICYFFAVLSIAYIG